MARREQVCVHLPQEIYLRALEDSKRFKFSFSDFVGRIIADFYRRSDEKIASVKTAPTDDELDRESLEAHSPNNPFKFDNLEEALAFLHGDLSSRI
jgi:hypothetical protein